MEKVWLIFSALILIMGMARILTFSVSGPFLIENLADGQYLDLANESRCLGVNVMSRPLTNKTCQMWDIYDLGGGYMIVNRFSGLVLDIADGGLKSNTKIIIWAATYACNQRWVFDADGAIRSGRNNLVLDVCNPKKGKSSTVIAYPKHRGKNQQFRVIVVGSYQPKNFNTKF